MIGTRVRKKQMLEKNLGLRQFFEMQRGFLFMDYLQTGITINSDDYCTLLNQLDAKVCEERPGLQKNNHCASK